jgi:phosphoenolpyruvate-protein kinase (PTS system EI component)
MKFIYVFSEDVAKDMELSGFKKLEENNEVIIDGKKAIVFVNNKESYLNKYQKQYVLLSNKLFF